MSLKTHGDRLCAALRSFCAFLVLRIALTLQWAGEGFLRGLRTFMVWSYPTFLIAMATALLVVLLKEAWEALAAFVRAIRDLVTDSRELSYRSWRDALPRMREQRQRRDG